jgi:hypothetical protein
LEIAVRPRGTGDYVPRAPQFGDGDQLNNATPYVPISTDEEYEVRIFNDDKSFDAAAEVLVDGVNSLYFWNVEKAFAPASRLHHWLVPRAEGNSPGTVRVAGWQRNSSTAERFVVRKFSESVAAELNLQNTDDKIGTISVILYPAWKDGERGSLSGTGRGDPYVNPVKSEVRHFGQLKASFSVRYSLPD